MSGPKSKLVSHSDAKEIISKCQSDGQRVVFTNGCFDIIHSGHVTYLWEAKQQGDFLVLALNSDSSIKAIKGPLRPIVSEHDRVIVLSALEMIDLIVLFDDETPIPLIEMLKPDLQVKGGDYRKEELPEYKTVKAYGGDVKVLSLVEGQSTSSIIDSIIKVYS